MYQVRITDADGTNPIILETADNISYTKTTNSANEGISFDIPAGDAKSAHLDYTKLWEYWDTKANVRKNRGPIHSIADSDDGVLKVTGPGRSQFLADHIDTELIAFYANPAALLSSLTFENVAAGPAVNTYVWDGKSGTKSKFFPGDINIDEDQYMQYYGLSKQTKDNAIDDNTGYILPGAERPSNTYSTTDSFWAGTDKKDAIVIDLGGTYNIEQVKILFPWWGGSQRMNDRGFCFRFYYATHLGEFDDLTSGDWVLAHQDTAGTTVTNSPGGWQIVFGSGTNTGMVIYTGITLPEVRYFKVLITDVKAWYGNIFDLNPPENLWDWQCNPDATQTRDNANGKALPPAMIGKKINDRTIEPPNDCYASLVEFAAYVRLVETNTITRAVKQRIRSDNKQIKYFHTADASETITTDNYRKFEPGNFFTEASISFSGANNSYTKFFAKDCTNCYSSFSFAVLDDYNSMVYRTDNSSGSPNLDIPRYARSITMKGASNAVVSSVNTWPGKLDSLSWGGQYSYSSTAGDTAVLNFRGNSFIWWATVPASETGATVRIKYRTKNDTTGAWSAYTVLDNALVLPNDIASEIVYEVAYNTLFTGATYEVHIENLDGGFASIDSFGGWWVASLVDYNDDNDRIFLSNPDEWKQIYDPRFSGGTMLKTNKKNNRINFGFTGDRIQVYSAKGRHHGKISITMSHANVNPSEYDSADDSRVFIPGGDSGDGTLTVNLGTGKKGHEIPNYLIFDSDLLTGWKFGAGGSSMDSLPWGGYSVDIRLGAPFVDKYNADIFAEDSDQFVQRCDDCNPETDGTTEINKYIYFDMMALHEIVRMSGSWRLQKHTDILASICEALELEWDIGERGLTILPRLGVDTDILLLEGIDTVISSEIVKDGSKLATQLISSGADIDGLPLFSIVEDRKNRLAIGRTVQQIQDYRDIADYFTLIGVSRAELIRRRQPEYRINVTHVGYKYGLEAGDSFLVKKRTQDKIRARIITLTINQSKSAGITYELECEKWPPII